MRHNGALLVGLGGFSLFFAGCAPRPSIGPVPPGASGTKPGGAALVSSPSTEFGRFRDVEIDREASEGVLTLKIPLRKGERAYFYGDKEGPTSLYVDARVEPDGEWCPLDLRPAGTMPPMCTAIVPGEYPNGSTLQLRIRAGGETSVARLTGLPQTRERFDIRSPAQERYEPTLGVTLDAVGYHPRPRRAGDMPVAGIILRAKLPQEANVLWRLNNVSLETPFKPIKVNGFGKGSILRYELHSADPTYMEELAETFADRFPRIRIEGNLERCETRDETVNFGVVPTVLRGKTTYLTPKAEIKRTTSDGRVVTLHTRDAKENTVQNDVRTIASLSIDGGTPWPGEDEQVALWIPGLRKIRTEFRPNAGTSEVNLYTAPQKGNFRLMVTRIRRTDTYPLDLTPNVRPVGFTAFGSSRMGRSSYLGPADAARLALLPKD